MGPVEGAPDSTRTDVPVPAAADPRYAAYSNEALTALAAQWDTLDVHQRRALLTEVRQRMAQSRSQSGVQVIQIRTERRFGRIIRQPDGRVIRIETQVVQVRPVADPTSPRSSGSYGVGFERRTRNATPGQPGAAPPDGPAVAPVAAPVVTLPETVKPSSAPALQPIP